MSFQGDVGGIGLADLLQSLARGREGVLTLHAKNGLQTTVGLADGSLHLLPMLDEDPEIWRARARRAWVSDPDFRIDALRMEEIARAARLETLYGLLDAESVHFRFAPGPVPKRTERAPISASESGDEPPPGRDGVYCAPQPVEGLLLEYARLKDEAQSLNVAWPDCADAVLQRLDSGPTKGAVKAFHEQCDGTSSLAEIADRLGWTLRETRNLAVAELNRGALRFSMPEEILYLAQNELAAAAPERAAARLRAWLANGPCGPLAPSDAHGFEREWQAGRLEPALRLLSARETRTFVRRIDHSLESSLESMEHWQAIVREKENDRIARLRLIAWQLRASADPNVPSVRDLTSLARGLLGENRRLAAAAVLRIAASRAPETANVRFEIGALMLQAGAADEAAPFVLDSVRMLFEQGRSDEALPVLRHLVDALPHNREARGLYTRARAHAVRRTLVRKNSLVTMAVVLALSTGAVVQYRSHRDFELRLGDVTALSHDPRAALGKLDQAFPNDTSPRIVDLRKELEERARVAETALRTAWTDQYRDAATECTVGDMQVGLRRALEIRPPPQSAPNAEPLPLVSDLFNGLAARIEAQITLLGPLVIDSPDHVNAEQRLITSIRELEVILAGRAGEGAKDFAARLAALRGKVEARAAQRADDRARELKQQNLALQDQLIAAARAHAKAGDFTRSLASYQRLLATDETKKLGPLLAREIGEVQGKQQALARARELAEHGRHDDARATLQKAELDPRTCLLPWKVATRPPGARTKLSDGSERVTPFTYESTWDERITLKFELEGHEPVSVVVEHPSDRDVVLSRVAESAWNGGGRIEAPPVAVGDDHVVCDRAGTIARIATDGRVVWSDKLASLGGIARAPVFLPRRAGHLLVVSEDGDVWIVDAGNGEIEGPWSAGSPPVAGPTANGEGAAVRFRDGRTLAWSTRLLPLEGDAAAGDPALAGDAQLGTTAGLAMLRRRNSNETSLASPWSQFGVRIEDELFAIVGTQDGAVRAHIRRAGDWNYVAWEAPRAAIPRGRLWISDANGLRSFVP